MLRKSVGVGLVVLASLAVGSAYAAERPARTEGVGGAYKLAKAPGGISILDRAEKAADQVWRALMAAADQLRKVEGVAAGGGGDVKITPPALKGVGHQD